MSAPSAPEAAKILIEAYDAMVSIRGEAIMGGTPSHTAAVVARAYIKACEALEKTRLHLGRVSMGLTLPADDVQRTIRKIVDEQIAMIDAALSCSAPPEDKQGV